LNHRVAQHLLRELQFTTMFAGFEDQQ